MRPNARIPSLVATCLVVLLLAPFAGADEDAELAAAQAYARQQLIRTARLSVDPSDPKAGPAVCVDASAVVCLPCAGDAGCAGHRQPRCSW